MILFPVSFSVDYVYIEKICRVIKQYFLLRLGLLVSVNHSINNKCLCVYRKHWTH